MTFWDNLSFKTTVVIYPRSSHSLIIWAAADRLRPIKLCWVELGTYRFLTAPNLRNKELVFAANEKSLGFIYTEPGYWQSDWFYTIFAQSFAVLLTGMSAGQHLHSITSQ